MNITLRVLLILFSIGFFGLMWGMAARKKLDLNYMLLWLALALILILTVVFPSISIHVSAVLGFEVASNFVFFVLIGFIILICTSFSIHITKLNKKSNSLIQRMAVREYDASHDIQKHHSQKTLVIIPSYNESENIQNTIMDLTSNAPFADYIIINDGSTDNTADICHKNNLHFIDLPMNLGIGGAVQTGYQFAKKHNYDIAVQFDGDGQHNAIHINPLIEKIQNGTDIAVGSRFIEKEGFQSSTIRRIGIKWICLLMKILFHKHVTDPTSGFRVCNKKMISIFADEYPTDYPEPEILALIFRRKCTYTELPVKMNARPGGISSISRIKSFHYMLKVTLAIFNVLIQK